MESFSELQLPAALNDALERMNFSTPTPIQAQAIPLALEGRDVLGSAQTGTGKTAAFGIPLVACLIEHPTATALIMTPTRELAVQVLATLKQLTGDDRNMKPVLLIGGEAMQKQLGALKARPWPRIIVGTPGRINDHLNRGSLKLQNTRFLVLDETDRMLDMGFGIQIDQVVKHLSDDRQTLLFSATMPTNILKMAARYTRDAVRIAVGSANTPVAKIDQQQIHLSEAEKYGRLMEELGQRTGSVLVFVKTKWGADKLSERISKQGVPAEAIHGDLRQNKRDKVIAMFRDQRVRILVATDIAARGLDISHIEHVINYDLPQAPEDYIHRIGRTARAGAEGQAVNFITPADGAKWRAIAKMLGTGEVEEESVRAPRRGGGASGYGRSNGGFKPAGASFGRRDGGAGRSSSRSQPGSWRNDSRSEGAKPYRSAERSEFSDAPRGDRAERPQSNWRNDARPEGAKPYRSAERSDAPRGDRAERPQSNWRKDARPEGAKPYRSAERSDAPRGDRAERPQSNWRKDARPEGAKPYRSAERSDAPRGDRAERPQSNWRKDARPEGAKPYRSAERSDAPRGDRPAKPFNGERMFGDAPRGGSFKKTASGDAKPAGNRQGKPSSWNKAPDSARRDGAPSGAKPFAGKGFGPKRQGKPSGKPGAGAARSGAAPFKGKPRARVGGRG